MALLRACRADELGPGEAFKLDIDPPVAVFRTEDGDLYALDDTCTHAVASLSEGFIEDDTVECPVHMAKFCLKTGKPTCPPATKPVATHPVVVEGDDIFVDVTR